MKNNFLVLLAIVLSGCGASWSQESAGSRAPRTEESSTQPSDWMVDPVSGSFGLLHVGMSKERIISLDLPLKWGEDQQEGLTYEVVTVSAPGDIAIECVLSDDIVYRCSSESKRLRDPAGEGVGSSLRELRRAHPQGRLLVSYENGKNANFVLGGRMMFAMDVRLIKEECFELEQCVFDEDALRVVRIVITDV